MVDIVILGGGPAGLMAGIISARRGWDTVLIEKRSFPVGKPCGEGLMPQGVTRLQQLFPSTDFEPLPKCLFRGIRYISPQEREATGLFQGSPGWGIARTTLSQFFWEQARSLPNLQILEQTTAQLAGTPVAPEVQTSEGNWQPQLLIGADGLHSPTRHWAQLQGLPSSLQRWGIRQHFNLTPWADLVEVHWQPNLEAYVTPVTSNQIGIALLSNKTSLPRVGKSKLMREALQSFPTLANRLRGVSPSDEIRVVGPLHQRTLFAGKGRTLLIGDAAGYLDAITGEGISNALEQALLLDSLMGEVKNPKEWNQLVNHYRIQQPKLLRKYYFLTRLTLLLHRRPWLTELVVQTFAKIPGLFDQILSLQAGRPKRGPNWSGYQFSE